MPPQEKFDPKKFFEHTAKDEAEFEQHIEAPKPTAEQKGAAFRESQQKIVELTSRDQDMRSKGFESLSQKLAAKGISPERIAALRNRALESTTPRPRLEVIDGGVSPHQTAEAVPVSEVTQEQEAVTPLMEFKHSFHDAVARWKHAFGEGEDVTAIDKELTQLSRDVMRLAGDEEKRFGVKGAKDSAMAEMLSAKKEMDALRRKKTDVK